MPKSAKNTKNASDLLFKNRQLLNVILIILSLLFVYDLAVGGNIRFYAKWIECGSKPVETMGSGYLNSGANHYVSRSPVVEVIRSDKLYCTPLEAEEAGYSASPGYYYFPNLNKD